MPKIQTKHAVASFGAAAMIGALFMINSGTLPTSAISEDGDKGPAQVAMFVQQCNKEFSSKLNSCLAQATTRPALRKCLDAYWKGVSACVVRKVQQDKTGSGRSMEERHMLEKKILEQRERMNKESMNKDGFRPHSSMKPSTTTVKPSWSPGADGGEKKPPVTRPKTIEKLNGNVNHNRRDEI